MTKEEKRRVIKGLSAAFGLTFFITGLVFLWMGRAGIEDVMTEKKPAYSATDVGINDLHEGDHVTVDAPFVADYVLEKVETLKTNGYITDEQSRRYYLVPVMKSDGQMVYLDHMVLVSRKGKYKEIDESINSFLQWWNSEDISLDTMPNETVMSVDGRVAKLTNEELTHVKEYFDQGGMDYQNFVAPYVIKPLWDEVDQTMTMLNIYMGVGSIAIGLILVSFAILYKRNKGRDNAPAGAPGQPYKANPGVAPAKDLRDDPEEFKRYMDAKVKELSKEQKADVLDLINKGQTIEAIKVFREMTGVGLAYAKEAVDHYDLYILSNW